MAEFPTSLVCDGHFRIDDEDEVDAVNGSRSIIRVTKDSQIPEKYALNKLFSPAEGSMQTVQHQKQSCHNFRFVHSSWGTRLSNVDRYGSGLLCLVTMATGNDVTEAKVKSLVEFFKNKCQCEPMRYNKSHILLHFNVVSDYNRLGEMFLNTQLDDCLGFQVTEIEPCILTALPICLIEINTAEADTLQDILTRTVLPFSSEFKFLALRETQTAETQPPTSDAIPNLCLTMLFAGNSQRGALRCLDLFKESPWNPYKLPKSVCEVLDENIQCFVHSKATMPMLAVRTGCPQPGVQITVFVKDSAKFVEMEQFYERLLGKKPYNRDVGSAKIHYCIFTCSNHSELVLASYPDVDTTTTATCSLNIQVTDVTAVPGAIKLSSDLAYLKDPEGNRVMMFTVVH